MTPALKLKPYRMFITTHQLVSLGLQVRRERKEIHQRDSFIYLNTKKIKKTLTQGTRMRVGNSWSPGGSVWCSWLICKVLFGCIEGDIFWCHTKKRFISRNHLSQVAFIVNVADSGVGEANEVVSARLLQQCDVLQVHLDSLKYLGQIPVVLVRNRSTINTS